MKKQEFLDSLKLALSNRVSASVVTENIMYYEDYINTQVRMGKSEEEVIELLGDPRLLARSIAEANKRAGLNQAPEAEYRNAGPNSSSQYTGYGEDTNQRKAVRMPGWLIALVMIAVIVLIFVVIFSVLSFLAPIILIVLFISLMVKLVRRS